MAQQSNSKISYAAISPLTSGGESDPEDDPTLHEAYDATDIAKHDRELLEDEEEREKLLTHTRAPVRSPDFFSKRQKKGVYNVIKDGDKPKRSRRSRRRRGENDKAHDEEGELMYEMEEGGPRSETSSQASQSSAELDKMNLARASSSKRTRFTWSAVTISIIGLFCLLTFGAYTVSKSSKQIPFASHLSNGSHIFAPTTILISLDGFRADFLQRGITPTLQQFILEGVSPKYMTPSFPSLTFPNHYTLVTGLNPESHGIVGNSFWAPDLKAEFHTRTGSTEQKWWTGAEPLWATAEKQNVTTAIHMWPGSESGIDFSATHVDKFNMTEVLPRKTARILELLDMPYDEDLALNRRPQFIAAYVPVVDSDGHKYGPNSTEIWDSISSVDEMLNHLFLGLDERNLTSIVNVVVVSDHGMATTSTDRCIQLDDLIDLDLVEHMDGWPLYGLRPKDPMDTRGLYDRLLIESQASGNFDVYLRDVNMPKRYHFSDNERIAPLWVVPKAGYAIVHKEDFDVKVAKANGETYHPKGLHGYDPEHPLMRAIFVARGPAFPHKPNSRLEVFQNTEVYNIICDSIGIEPKANNGTLRLPLKPVGLHSDHPSTIEDSPVDLPPDDDESAVSDEIPATDPSLSQDSASIPSNGMITVIEENTKTGEVKESKVDMNKFWAYVKAKMAAAKEWANSIMSNLKGHSEGSDGESGSFDQGDQPG